ncbi:MAG: DUF6446 family protein [Paracoccaceae bacterium]
MTGKVLSLGLLATAVIAGLSMWWLQTRAFYDELPAGQEVTLTGADGVPRAVPIANFRGIDSDSSPIRYRACFDVELTPEEAAATFLAVGAAPLVAPAWFDCFDAADLGAAIESGDATVVLGEADVTWGIDRVVAILPGGQGRAWNAINACGARVFDGDAPPEGCPPLPEGLR